MIVQHNITAMNANRMLGLTTGSLSKSTEKLSSGYKINRAADDAAGLSISEKMRKQIRGLSQASTNAEDGISCVQTAEGALNEIHSMLQRMNELAVQSANGTNSESDRTAIQNEIDQLSTEIDRVSETTKYNETYLLKGDKSLAKGYTYSYGNFKNAQAGSVKTASKDKATELTYTWAAGNAINSQELQDEQNELLISLRDQGVKISATKAKGTGTTTKYKLELTGDAAEKFTVAESGTAGTFNIQDKQGNILGKLTVSGKTIADSTTSDQSMSATVIATDIVASESQSAKAKYYDKDGNAISANALSSYFTTDTAGNTVPRADAPKIYDAVGNIKSLNEGDISALQDLTADLTVKLHVGADATANNQISINIASMSAKGLGVNGLKVDGTDDTNALNAIDTIKASIQKVSDQRSALGAVQNRLEHTIANLDNVVENTTAAESRIRDTDMAEEMVTYSKNSILQQAGQSMLAQANQANQGVLSLLQ